MKNAVARGLFGLSAVLLAGLVAVVADDTPDTAWPQFRGPHRDGISAETGLLASWPGDGPPEIWRASLGSGFSGISVIGDRIYTMAGRDGGEHVVCLSAIDGAEIWNRRLNDEYSNRFGGGPRATPTVDGDALYALSAKGTLVALAVGDGSELWKHDLVGEYGAKPPRWGVSSSPLVLGDRLIVNVGGAEGRSVMAFDKRKGTPLWSVEKDGAGYAAPLAVEIAGLQQVLVFTAQRLIALSPEDGRLLWELAWKTSYDVNAATPVFVPPDRVLVSSGYDTGAALLRVTTSGDQASIEEVWRNREMKNQFSSSVLHDGHLYGFDDKTLKCVEVETGRTLWKERGFGHGSLFYADGYLYVLGDGGRLALVKAASDGYHEAGSLEVFGGKTWTVPTLSAGRLYVRDEKEIVALDVAEKADR